MRGRIAVLVCAAAVCVAPASAWAGGTQTTTSPTAPAGKPGGGHSSLFYIVAPILLLLGGMVYFRSRPGGYAGRRDDRS